MRQVYKSWLGLVAVGLALGLAACRVQPGEALVARATTDKADNQVQTRVENGKLVVDVFSPSGIGSADVELTGAQRPATIVIRLHLKGLEGLTFTYPNATVQVAVASSGDHTVSQQANVVALPSPARAIDSASPYWLAVRLVGKDGAPGKVPLQDGYVEVTPPQDFRQGNYQGFSLEWIDFYR